MPRPPTQALVAAVLALTMFMYISGTSDRFMPCKPVPPPKHEPVPTLTTGPQGILPVFQAEPDLTLFRSRLCSYTHASQEWVTAYINNMGDGPNRLHRKQWEFAVIVEALDKLRMLGPNKIGLGFAVGQEPLARYFVKRGSSVTVSDMPLQGNFRKEWASTGQHANELEYTFRPGIVTLEEYKMRANFEPIDMNNIPKHLLQGHYDFIWSCGSLEHVGVGQASLQFIINSLDALKVGGVAAHTTEFLLNSQSTFEAPGLNFFTEQEMQDWATVLRELGHTVVPLEFAAGTTFDVDSLKDHRYSNHIQVKDMHTIHTSVSFIVIKGKPTGKHVPLPRRRK
eukprot:TRINITY_DN346_c0_g4_i1.p1 TRINITY_DN346_c0_g4~~TRINITY_DN346_c0_g4_i1.p1  ORF type:complete len:339 (+),score=91.96 TRINITY_DN346_c0_g4_i1:51-1067(+)